jgi:hypothetical protein
VRITLTIDDDVAASLERLRKTRDGSLKALVNEALRRGVKDMNARARPRQPFRTRAVDLCRPQIASLDNVNDTLALAEREAFR